MTERRKRSARFTDIAEAAGVSVATVDRVLNERDSVSARARARVLEAARQLDLPRRLPDARHGLIHLDIVLPDNVSPFFRRLDHALQRATALLGPRIVVHRRRVAEADTEALLRAITLSRYPRQGLMVAAPDTSAVQQALAMAARRGERVATLVTEVSGIDAAQYVGIDNYAAGRTAGHLLGRFARGPGRIVLLSGRSDYRGHVERARGCIDALATSRSRLRCDWILHDSRDDSDRCYLALQRTFKTDEAVVGIYNTGAGSPGISAALQRYRGRRPNWIGHELSDDHRQYLKDGSMDVVIDQDPDRQAVDALQHVLATPGTPSARPSRGEFRLYLAENLSPGLYGA